MAKIIIHINSESLNKHSKKEEKMRKVMIGLISLVLILSMAGIASAGNTAQQTVTFQVTAINELAVSGNPAALVINSAVAGSGPSPVTDSSTTYDITTNEAAKKITGSIDVNMPANTTLEANLTAPTGGSSTGYTTLSTTSADLVTGISTLNESGKGIDYRFSATMAAGILASDTRTVTLTLTN
jgi:hypothetical protein